MWPEEIIEYLECGCGFRGNKCGRLSGSVKVESMSRRPWPSSFRGTGRTSQNSQPATASQIFTDLHRSSQIFTVSQLHWRKAWWKSDRKIQKNIEKLCLKFQKLKTLKIMKNLSTFSGWHHSPLAAPLKYLPLSLSLSLSESAWCTETVAHPRHRRNSARDLKSSTWILQEFLPWSWNSMEFRQSSRAAP